MARDIDSKSTRLYDKRTFERSIKKGLMSRKDYEKHLKSLDDVADKGVYGTGAEHEEPSRAEPPGDGVGASSAAGGQDS
jgi:hypothetical protein